MFDVIIVGGGVSGTYLAHRLGAINPNLNLLVLEKDKKVLLKDSGIVSKRFTDFYKEPGLIEHEITSMKAVSPFGSTFCLNSKTPFAYILKRKKFTIFSRKLASRAAKIKYDSVTNIEYHQNSVSVRTNKNEYTCKMIVGADGAASIVRSFAGIQRPPLFTGTMIKTKKPLEFEEIHVYLNKYFSPDFFSWVIPQTNEYGIMTAYRPKEHLNYFKKCTNLPEGDVYTYLIPIGCTKSYSKNTILVGDSCGQTKPISGGGIIFSLLSVNHAANTIIHAFENNKFDEIHLSNYEDLWKSQIGSEIKKQILLRKFYRKMSNTDIENFFKNFGKHIEKTNDFDYDKLSQIAKQLPKWKILTFLIKNRRILF
jgi:flavin-dependent dehydrogenase